MRKLFCLLLVCGYAGGAAAQTEWSLTGNSGTSPGTHFIGTLNSERLVIKTNNTEQATILANGNFGIGTTAPLAKLSITGTSVTAGYAGITEITTGTGALNDNKLVFGVHNGDYSWIQAITPGIGLRDLALNPSGGHVGIGTTTPLTTLDIIGPSGVTAFTGTTNLGVLIQGPANGTDYTGIDFNRRFQTGPTGRIAVLTGATGSYMSFGTSNSYGIGITNTAMTIDPSGNVGIGTTSPVGKLDVNGNIYTNGKILINQQNTAAVAPYALAVNGTAIFTKVLVKLNANWPDFVFKPSYKLKTLYELEAYVLKNQHLPDVPSATEVEKTGIDLGDNQTILLKKVEELTLYMIELNKKVDAFSKENEALKKKVNACNR